MRPDQLPEHKRPNYVLPRYKVVYVAVSKAACTSLKWLVADVQGEDPEQFRPATSRMVTRDMCIHHRGLWRRTPTLHSLSEAELAAISPEDGWFIFTVVRHPSARLFSAWQSKLLLREPRWRIKHCKDPWYPRVPKTTADVVEDFRRFALALAADPGQRIMEDRHFMPQWRAASPDRVPYSRVYDTAEIPELMADLERHLRRHGFEGELRLRESNETPLKPVAAAFGHEVGEALLQIYPDDFARLGYADVVPASLHSGDRYPDAAFAEIARLVERHERIGDLAEVATRLKEELAAARAAPAVPDRAGSAATRLRRRVSAVLPGR